MSSRNSRPDSRRDSEQASSPDPSGKRKKLLANHQRSWIWGKHLVQETLAAGRWPILELILANDLVDADLSQSLRAVPELQPLFADRKRLTQLCGSHEHQGWLARVGPYPYVPIETLLLDRPPAPFWLLVEGIQDPFNLGAILRSAEVFAVTAVSLGTVGQTGINSLAARSSVGAVNRLRIARVDDLVPLIEELRRQRITVIGTSLEASVSLEAIDCTGVVAVVIGNEGRGLSTGVAAACSHLAKIPQPGTLNSLNAAAAAAIACYEVQRQRREKSVNWTQLPQI